jgi:CheY-like chemotaxis protein
VRSVEGEGSAFTLHLPIVVGETVLLVEDNRASRLVATRILERIGYQVRECEDGQAALEAVAGQRFQRVVQVVLGNAIDFEVAPFRRDGTHFRKLLQALDVAVGI